jgi:glutamine---fructose-6-phosphate transaminase (isomerizing)
MCGISAILGNNCVQILLEALKQMQNRGYDSAGICSIEHNPSISYRINKYASSEDKTSLSKLEDTLNEYKSNNIGIAHTRWATHGPKTDINSHPHISYFGMFALVHNGIIENYATLKKFLIEQGFKFKSQTDTEVIVNLLEYNYKQRRLKEDITGTNVGLNDIIVDSIKQTTLELEGTWGLTIICLDTPDILYCVRQGSPLLVSYNDDYALIVSEQSGFCNYVQNYIVLENNDICYFKRSYVEKNKYNITMNTTSNHKYEIKQLNVQHNELTPYPYPHWTLKEIHEQVNSSLRVISMGGRLLSNNKVIFEGLSQYKKVLLEIDNIILLGCGTSYHAGMVGIHYFKELSNFNTVQIFDGAEFSVEDIPRLGKTALIFISQSGETKDLHRCIKIGKDYECIMIGVVNEPDSMIAREVHCGCYLNAGREVAVASTKSFTNQVILLSMIAIWFSQHKEVKENKRLQHVNDLRRLYLDIEKTIKIAETQVDEQLCNLFTHHSCFVLGKGKGEAIAREGSLKIKEISYIHSEGYSASSLKHGPFALLCKGFPVILVDVSETHHVKMKNVYEEIKSRHATTIVITYESLDNVNNNIVIPYNKSYGELLSVIVMQMIAYKLSVTRGINPDMPKNLAKVVTVE